MALQYFFYVRIVLLVTEFKKDRYKIGVSVGERGVCILMTGLKQPSPSF
jgi:hypothetical protein